MFSRIGIPELVLIAVIALLIFGPGKLAGIGKLLGSSVREFKNAASELKSSMDLDTENIDTKKKEEKKEEEKKEEEKKE